MKPKPILFSTPMVQAILEGRKTMTMRIVKFPNDYTGGSVYPNGSLGLKYESKVMSPLITVERLMAKYQVEDILWVRESWRIRHWDFEDGEYTVEYKNGAKQICELREDADEWLLKTWEKAISKDYLAPSFNDEEVFVFTDKKQPFSPSIHMPFDAARIFLEVTNVRCGRLHDISEADAIAEGIESTKHYKTGDIIYRDYTYYSRKPQSDRGCFNDPIKSFKSLWESINGPGSWEANPWVFVYEFKRVEKPNAQ